jgi:hypothetical protein
MKRILQTIGAALLGFALAATSFAQAPEKKKITIAVGGKNLFDSSR